MQTEHDSIREFVSDLPDRVSRIAICGTSYNDVGGVARVVEQQASELTGEGYDVEIFALEGSRDPPENVPLHVLGRFESSPYKEVDKLLTLASPSALRFIRVMADFDLIIAHRFPFSTLAHASKLRNDVTYVYWSHPSGSSDELFDGLAHVWARVQHHLETKNYAIRCADYICAVSEESKSYIEKKTGRKAIVVPNTVTESRFSEIADEETINDRFNLSPEDQVVLHVGRISPRKNIHKLVDVFQNAVDSSSHKKLLLAGEESMPEYSERVRYHAGENVVFTGFVEDEILAGIYDRGNIYATCSLSEGWGLPLSEASYFDLDIVAFESIPAAQSLGIEHTVTDEEYQKFEQTLNRVLDGESNQ